MQVLQCKIGSTVLRKEGDLLELAVDVPVGGARERHGGCPEFRGTWVAAC